MKKVKKKVVLPQPSPEETEAKKRAEEFWADPCWTEPLEEKQLDITLN